MAAIGCDEDEVFIASTGVIGNPMPPDAISRSLPTIAAKLSANGWEDAAEAIRTTDTFAKAVTRTATIGGTTVTINGIAKGSGMIAPDMATMLGYVFTDAAVEPGFLQACLTAANESTFSCITVDSDTSTSDTVLAFATGAAGNAPLTAGEPGADAFAAALQDVCRQLALLVVRDGEGAQKLIEIRVTGASSDDSARRVGLAVANSPLVKTAIAGEDANWGRVVMAVGKAGEPADRDKLSIGFGGTWAAREGLPLADYDEAPVAEHLKGLEVRVEVDLGLGHGRATVWTCDLTHGYIAVNADYRS
jgi:glutamate N-acetyltransferase/amino-acid N-acetyltransferase